MDELISVDRTGQGLVANPPDDEMPVWLSASPEADHAVAADSAWNPAPWWQFDLPDPMDLPGYVTHIPAGLWLRRPGGPDLAYDELCSEPPDPERMYVVVGAPGEQPPSPETVADVLRELPAQARDVGVLCWYGSGLAAGAVADELAASVRAVHGVPTEGALVFVDEDGIECWQPFAQESVYRPAGPPLLERWADPPGLTMVEPGSFELVDGWRVDVVPRGLVVRPELARAMPGWGGATGPTADVVVASSGVAGIPIEAVVALDDLLRDLPDDAAECLRLLPVDAAAAEALVVSEHAEAVVYDELDVPPPAEASEPEPALEPQTVWITRSEQPAPAPSADPIDHPQPPVGAVIVTSDGRVVPEAPIVTLSAVPWDSQAAARPVSGAPAPAADVEIRRHEHPRRRDDENPAVAPAAVAGLPPFGPATAPKVQLPSPPPAPPAPPPVTPVAPAQQVPSEEPPAELNTPAASSIVASAADVVTSPDPTAAVPTAEPSTPPAETARQQPRSVAAVGSEVEILPARMATVPQLQPPPPAERTPPPPADQAPEVAADRAPQTVPEEKQSPQAGPAEIGPAQATATVEVPEGARSTAEQRRGMRKKLGGRYDTASRAVTRLLSERPGLRFAVGDDAALLAELSVVRVFADDPAASYDQDFYFCLADGLRRLPTARAVVVRGIPADTYVRPEMIVRVPAPVLASPATIAPPAGGAEALIWTTSGRRLDGLLDEAESGKQHDQPAGRACPKDVVLSGHTRLRVLAVESEPVQRLLLAEDGAVSEAALARRRAAATARAVAAAPQPAVDVKPWFQSIGHA